MQQARQQIEETFGPEFLHFGGPRFYKGKVQNAQEAHEAIRPAGGFRTPGDTTGLDGRIWQVYVSLIWKQVVASQMAEARLMLSVDLSSRAAEAAVNELISPDFPGSIEGSDDPDAALEGQGCCFGFTVR